MPTGRSYPQEVWVLDLIGPITSLEYCGAAKGMRVSGLHGAHRTRARYRL